MNESLRGILEVTEKGFGFVREIARGYQPSRQDPFVSPDLIKRLDLRKGSPLQVDVEGDSKGGRKVTKVLAIGGKPLDEKSKVLRFEDLTTINPEKPIILEHPDAPLSTRVLDLFVPLGKGQRGLIVAPPRTGKTILMQQIAESVRRNHPEIYVYILLVDERPEEVTELKRHFREVPSVEVAASSNDQPAQNHLRISQLIIEAAKRRAEVGEDVLILLDSITRLGRAFNSQTGNSGRTLSGGMDSRGLEIPRRLFATARQTEEAGSVTIIATALVDTGSRMDEVIFQEFKGTGNMELVLDRRMAEQRIWPAINLNASGTRREELLLPAEKLNKIQSLRRELAVMSPVDAMTRLLQAFKGTQTNEELLAKLGS